jgi:hypothetical protein
MAQGTYTINTAATFAAVFLMASGPRTKYGTTEQDRTAEGLPRWECQLAVTFLAEPGQRPVSDVLSVTIAAEHDPAASITPGTPVELTDLRLGVSQAEARQDGRGVRGGRPYYTASGIRPALHTARKAEQAA